MAEKTDTEKIITVTDGPGFLLFLVLLPVLAVINYLVIRQLYLWFILSAFPSAPVLTTAQIGGLATIVYYFKSKAVNKKGKPVSETNTEMFVGIVQSLVGLGIGYIVNRFIQAGY